MKDKEEIERICFTCGAKCCKPHMINPPFGLYLRPGDITPLIKCNLTGFINENKYFKDKPRFAIRPHFFGYCPFFNYGRLNCRIHNIKAYPSLCKLFPFDPVDKHKVRKMGCLLIKKINPEMLSSTYQKRENH